MIWEPGYSDILQFALFYKGAPAQLGYEAVTVRFLELRRGRRQSLSACLQCDESAFSPNRRKIMMRELGVVVCPIMF